VIIDMRCRLTTREAAKYFFASMEKAGRLSEVPSLVEGTTESFFREIAAAGVTTAVSVSGMNPGGVRRVRRTPHTLPKDDLGAPLKYGVKYQDRSTSNDLLAQVQKEYPGRFIGAAGIDVSNTFHNALEEIERCVKDLGLKVVCIEPGHVPGYRLHDRRLLPIYQKCMDLGMPIILHTGPFGARYVDNAHPIYIDQVADDFPDLPLICGHGCYPFVREIITVAARRDNVYPSPDLNIFRLGTEDWLKAVNENIGGLSDKFLFGSAYPLISIKSYIDRFFKLPWKEEVLDKILYKNALRALKLGSDPVFREMYKIQ
jgi:predicted TIM-barrel fold metal-dependent hydrolase